MFHLKRTAAVAAMVLVSLGWRAGTVTAVDPPGESTGGVAPLSESKSSILQDQNWQSLKNAYRIGLDASGKPDILSAAPSTLAGSGAGLLSASVTQWVVEPQGNLYDDLHHAESDRNYWMNRTGFDGGSLPWRKMEPWQNTLHPVPRCGGTPQS